MQRRPVNVITGVSRGLGKELCAYYCEKGHQVIGISRQPAEFRHKNFTNKIFDITDESSVSEFFFWLSQEFGACDYLINNAAQTYLNHFLLTPKKQFDEILKVNLSALFHMSQEAARLMVSQKQGRIVNIGSIATDYKVGGHLGYLTSKELCETLTKFMAMDLLQHNVTVNCVAPGAFPGRMFESLPAEIGMMAVERLSGKKLLEYDDIFKAIDFYLDDKSSKISGQTTRLG